MPKEIEYVVVSYEQFTDYEFCEPGSFFIMDSMQNYVFFKTSDRAKAQAKADELYGPNRYTVKTSKNQKTKSKLESGGYSAVGTSSRRGMGSWLRKTV